MNVKKLLAVLVIIIASLLLADVCIKAFDEFIHKNDGLGFYQRNPWLLCLCLAVVVVIGLVFYAVFRKRPRSAENRPFCFAMVPFLCLSAIVLGGAVVTMWGLASSEYGLREKEIDGLITDTAPFLPCLWAAPALGFWGLVFGYRRTEGGRLMSHKAASVIAWLLGAGAIPAVATRAIIALAPDAFRQSSYAFFSGGWTEMMRQEMPEQLDHIEAGSAGVFLTWLGLYAVVGILNLVAAPFFIALARQMKAEAPAASSDDAGEPEPDRPC